MYKSLPHLQLSPNAGGAVAKLTARIIQKLDKEERTTGIKLATTQTDTWASRLTPRFSFDKNSPHPNAKKISNLVAVTPTSIVPGIQSTGANDNGSIHSGSTLANGTSGQTVVSQDLSTVVSQLQSQASEQSKMFKEMMVGRVKGYHKDRYGRWTRVDLLGRSGNIVSVICAYQVVQEQGQHGDQTAYSQQVRMMRLEGNEAPDPRPQFIQDLTTLIKSLNKSNQDILLMGDFNESIGANPARMASVMTSGFLTDVFCYRHGLHQEKPTYARGSKRVDYILTSQRLVEHVKYTGAEPFNSRIFSDHQGLFVDFRCQASLIRRQTY
jgi:hypothetical protein